MSNIADFLELIYLISGIYSLHGIS